jgi:hypothetical protein
MIVAVAVAVLTLILPVTLVLVLRTFPLLPGNIRILMVVMFTIILGAVFPRLAPIGYRAVMHRRLAECIIVPGVITAITAAAAVAVADILRPAVRKRDAHSI